MAINSSLFEPTATVDERLEALGISRQILYDAIMAGEAARATCTSNDPPILPGLLAWGRTVRALGELLAPLGWKRRDEGNYSTIEDGRLGIAIAVATVLSNPEMSLKRIDEPDMSGSRVNRPE